MKELFDRPVVLVDVDGVLANFDGRVQTILSEEYPEIQIMRRKSFYIADDYDDRIRDIVDSISLRSGFFRELEVIDGALDGWGRIVDAGYRPQICSSPLTRHPDCATEKLAWITSNFVPTFGAWVVETAIVDKNKHHHDGIALIDDRPAVKRADEATWRHIVFDREYNQESNAGLRLYGWSDPNLETLLSTAATH